MKKEIKELIKAMHEAKGEDATISIFHKLYGEQKLKCAFNPIVDERIGFNIKNHDIYIEKDKITEFNLGDNIYFTDDIMEIIIKIE